MKILFSILVLVAFAFADNDGCTETCIGIDPGTSGSDAVSLTLLSCEQTASPIYTESVNTTVTDPTGKNSSPSRATESVKRSP